MTENNNIENLFKEAFHNYEAPVDASLWQGIEQVVSQPVADVSVVSNAGSIVKSFSVVKLFVAAAAVSLVGAATYFVFKNKDDKSSYQTETNTNLFNNAGSVSEALIQPSPEKIVVEETKPVSVTKKQSSPEIFSAATTAKNIKQETLTSTTSQTTAPDEKTSPPKPSETPFQTSGAVGPQGGAKKEVSSDKIESPGKVTPSDASPRKEIPENKAEILTFPGIDKQVFTPNGDGQNDVFEVEDDQMQSVDVKIRSVSGKEVYSSLQPGANWDGKLQNGDEAPEGLYIVFINGTGLDGKKYTRVTRLLLQRK